MASRALALVKRRRVDRKHTFSKTLRKAVHHFASLRLQAVRDSQMAWGVCASSLVVVNMERWVEEVGKFHSTVLTNWAVITQLL